MGKAFSAQKNAISIQSSKYKDKPAFPSKNVQVPRKTGPGINDVIFDKLY